MYFTVNDLPEILDAKPMPRGYLIGTTNKFVKSLNKLQPDLVVDIDADLLVIEKETHKQLLKTKPSDKQLFDSIHEAALKPLDAAQKEQLRAMRPLQELDVVYLGSEDWIRS